MNACVFGLSNCDDELEYEEDDGRVIMIKMHQFMKLISAKHFQRTFSPLHIMIEA
eukprot:CAMPEP_0202976756 /NCGR_PEP_ID=MMETSP1396-20130829/80288_1 /ASSEMBLY_ACC=CAM_ASM_000872 /TAXON_ID= /ORGANISM="Pseudokeronopsis sp., Strain Brazil" /LENGTH=54 /DNA_ID=CAMNT_0049714647 /DNA_START=246 /DNA_END=406 /DNA_ORIENTATION=+